MTDKILRLPEVENKIGRKRSSIYADIGAGTFPAPINLGARAVGWLESEVNQWIETKIAASRRGR